jgi:gamma-carbonic anhydrase
VLRGDSAPIRVGAYSNIQDGSVVHVSGKLRDGARIGARVTIGHMTLIHACTLEDGCFIGMKAMDGTLVESGAWVAAGAAVTPGKRVMRDVSSGRHAGPLPTRRDRGGGEVHRRLPKLYARLADEYR